ncbi:MAG TPA: sulfatase-like hydrolase/transferase [Thermoanaerobaculia bacterium]|nr:sulfatase-like hydrolase/transferase [Thermoanaerobaculia bacterium]
MRPSSDFSIFNFQFSIPLSLLLLLLGCTRAEPKHPNVLLITLDTFRADRLGAKTPNLTRLAAEGVRFENAQSPVPLTLPAHATILSGLLPLHHGLRNNGAGAFPADKETLATLFAANGYRTAAFVGAFVLDRRFGLDRGFETYDDDIARDPASDVTLEAERLASDVVDRAVAWLRVADSRPAFTWVHLWDAHAPYAPPAPFEQSYDGEIAYVDAQLGRLLAAIDRTNTVVVVAGDHGESLGEHGESTHGLLLYQTTLHIPLLIATPELKPRAVREPVSSVDIAPTLATLAGITMPKGDGRDLAEVLRDGDAIAEADLYAETQYPLTFGWSELAALRRGNLKLISGPAAEIFDVQRDPRETTNVLANERRAFRDLTAKLDALRATAIASTQATVDEETKAKLASLGYIAPGPSAKSSADPKAMAPLFLQFEKALAAKDAASLADLVRRDPANPVFRSTLARFQRERGATKEAVALYRQAVALTPNDADAWYNLGVAAAECCDREEARQALTTAARLDPKRAATHNALGILQMEAGEPEGAVRTFQQAIESDPRDARGWNNLGNALRTLGRLNEAETAYRKATTLAPTYADPFNGLGVLLVQQRLPREALPYFETAIRNQPDFYEAQLNRGIALQEAGDRAGAVAQYRALLEKLPAGPRYDTQRDAARTLLASLAR